MDGKEDSKLFQKLNENLNEIPSENISEIPNDVPIDVPIEIPVKNTKITLISLYENILKKVTEILKNIQNFCKRTFENISESILEKFRRQEEEVEI